jgi:hypothetical protein
MSPWVTREAIGKEYDGVVWMNGLTALLATPNLNIAIGVGIDYLLDGNRTYWIYQNQPWNYLLDGNRTFWIYQALERVCCRY